MRELRGVCPSRGGAGLYGAIMGEARACAQAGMVQARPDRLSGRALSVCPGREAAHARRCGARRRDACAAGHAAAGGADGGHVPRRL